MGSNVADYDGSEERLFAGKPAIDGRLTRAGQGGNLIDSRAGKSAFEKYVAGRIEDAGFHLSNEPPRRAADADGTLFLETLSCRENLPIALTLSRLLHFIADVAAKSASVPLI